MGQDCNHFLNREGNILKLLEIFVKSLLPFEAFILCSEQVIKMIFKLPKSKALYPHHNRRPCHCQE